MSSQPGSVGTRCAANAACSAVRSGEGRHRHPPGAQGAGDAVGVQQRLGGEVERAGRAPVQDPDERVGDVVGVHERDRQRRQRQRQQPGHRRRAAGGRRRTAAARGSSGRSRCRRRAAGPGWAGRRSASGRRCRPSDLADDALGLGLVAAVLRARDAGGRPVLGDLLAHRARARRRRARTCGRRGATPAAAAARTTRRVPSTLTRRSSSGSPSRLQRPGQVHDGVDAVEELGERLLARRLARGRRGASARRS